MRTTAFANANGTKWAFVAYITALSMTLWAVTLDITTVATNDDTWILIEAMTFVAGAMVLLLVAWRRVPTPGRVIAAFLILVDVYLLWNAGVAMIHSKRSL
jgi:hypothetical protein